VPLLILIICVCNFRQYSALPFDYCSVCDHLVVCLSYLMGKWIHVVASMLENNKNACLGWVIDYTIFSWKSAGKLMV
jgi:hypothetical protein